MRKDRRWSVGVALVFGAAAFVVAFNWYVFVTYTESTETLRDGLTAADLDVISPGDLLTMVGAATIGGTVVGGPAWALLVERWDRWSITRRGALAGGCTGAFAIPVAAVAFYVLRAPYEGLPVEPVLFGLAFGFFGIVLYGWTTVPPGVAVGYLLALWRSEDVTPVWRLVGERLR